MITRKWVKKNSPSDSMDCSFAAKLRHLSVWRSVRTMAGLSYQGGIEHDFIYAGQGLGNRTAIFGLGGVVGELIGRQSGNFCLAGQFDFADGGAVGQMDSGGGIDAGRREAVAAQESGEKHRKAAGMGCADQFFGIGAGSGLEAGGKGERAFVEAAA